LRAVGDKYTHSPENNNPRKYRKYHFILFLFNFEIFNYDYSKNRDNEEYTSVNILHDALLWKKK